MEKEVVAALLGALGGLASGAITAWVAMKTKRIDEALTMKTKQIDEALTIKTKQMDQAMEELKLWVSAYEARMLEQRLADYRKLWKLTEPTSRRKIATLTSQSASALAEELTEWYYHQGGMVLSDEARDKFFAARGSLEPSRTEQDPTRWHTAVVNAFSFLRTALCEDMNSRRGPRLRGGEDKDLELDARIESQAG